MTLTAKRTEKRQLRRSIGLETLVDWVVVGCLIFGVIVAIGLLMTLNVWGFVGSVSALVGFFLHWLVLRCLAEHLRLQKKDRWV